jgi:hypothetical protein
MRGTFPPSLARGFNRYHASGSSSVWSEFHGTFSDDLIQAGHYMLRFPKLPEGVSTGTPLAVFKPIRPKMEHNPKLKQYWLMFP